MTKEDSEITLKFEEEAPGPKMSESVQQAQGFYSTFSVWHQYFSQTYSQGQS